MNNANVNGARATMIGKTASASVRPGHHRQQPPQQQGHQFHDIGNFSLNGNGIAMGGGMHQLPPGMTGQMPQGMNQNMMVNMVNMRNSAQGMGMGRGASRP